MTFIDFFAGVGGFTKGMTQAGHKPVGWCEIDKFARMSYEAIHCLDDKEIENLKHMDLKRAQRYMKNRKKGDEWNATDIRLVQPRDLPEADCYCFGFPCQAFSIAGQRRGFEDTRGTLFFEIMRLARERKPKYLFAENVAGLLNHEGGELSQQSSIVFGNLIMMSKDKFLTAKTSEFPKTGSESSLSQILEDNPDPKYFLSSEQTEKLLKQIAS